MASIRALTEQARSTVEPAGTEQGHRRPGAGPGVGPASGTPTQHQPLDPVGHQCGQPDGNPPPERVADHAPPVRPGRSSSSEQRDQVAGHGRIRPPGLRRRRSGPEPGTGRGRWRSPWVPASEPPKTEGAKSSWVRRHPWRARTVGAPPTPKSRRTGDRRRTTSAPAHPTDSLASRGTIRPVGDRAAPGRGGQIACRGRYRCLRTGAWSCSPSRSAVPSTRRPALCVIAGAGSGKTRKCSLFGRPDASKRVQPMPITRPSAHSPAKRPANCANDSTTTGCWCPRPPGPGSAPTGPGVRLPERLHQLALTLLPAARSGTRRSRRLRWPVSEHRFRMVSAIIGERRPSPRPSSRRNRLGQGQQPDPGHLWRTGRAGRPHLRRAQRPGGGRVRGLRSRAPQEKDARPGRRPDQGPPTSSTTTSASPNASTGATWHLSGGRDSRAT